MPDCVVCLVGFAPRPFSRLPKLLNCGHTLCSKCLSLLMARQKKKAKVAGEAAAAGVPCPCCRVFSREPHRGFPLNYALVEALEEAEARDKENVHSKDGASALATLDLLRKIGVRSPSAPTGTSRRRATTPNPVQGLTWNTYPQSRSSTPPATPTRPSSFAPPVPAVATGAAVRRWAPPPLAVRILSTRTSSQSPSPTSGGIRSGLPSVVLPPSSHRVSAILNRVLSNRGNLPPQPLPAAQLRPHHQAAAAAHANPSEPTGPNGQAHNLLQDLLADRPSRCCVPRIDNDFRARNVIALVRTNR
ncbi:hypothetical protein DIPPA_28195 [Diplonema papillatum]|nr:hypothetical protein DIPPA_28195 [Diplonema papillatum]